MTGGQKFYTCRRCGWHFLGRKIQKGCPLCHSTKIFAEEWRQDKGNQGGVPHRVSEHHKAGLWGIQNGNFGDKKKPKGDSNI